MPRNPNSLRRSSTSSSSSSATKRRLTFPLGSEVEVRSNDVGFKGAWFEATVTKSPEPNSHRYGITYKTLIADERRGAPLKEVVHSSFIRPRPPHRPDSNSVFGIYQEVEAFHNDGWWPGVVVKLPAGCGSGGLYSVCFPMSREEFRFAASALRRRLKWLKGNWVSFEAAQFQEGEHVIFGKGTRVEVSGDREKYGTTWFIGTVQKIIGKSYFLVEYENLTVDSNGRTESLKEIVDEQYIRPCPPVSESSSFDVLNEVEVFNEGGWYSGLVSVIYPGPQYVVKYKNKEELVVFDPNLLRPRHEWTDGNWVQTSEGKGMMRPSLESGIELSQPCKKLKKGNLPEENSELVSETNTDLQLIKKQGSPMRTRKKRSLRPHVPDLTCGNNDGEVADISGVSSSKDVQVEKPYSEVKSSRCSINDGNTPASSGISVSNKQLGLTEDAHALPPTDPNAKSLEHNAVQQSPMSRSYRKSSVDKLAKAGAEAQTQTRPSIENIVHEKYKLIPCPSYTAVEMETAPIDLTFGASSLSKEDDVCNASESNPSKDGVSDHNEFTPNGSLLKKPIAEMGAASCDHTPNGPLPCDGDILDHYNLSPSVFPSVSCSFANSIEGNQKCFNELGGNVVERDVLAPKNEEVAKTLALIDPLPMEFTSERAELPFTKQSELWNSVESAGVFRVLPQHPHFRPLLQRDEELREGDACGLMITFTRVVANVSNLRIADPEVNFERKLKALDHLEKHGFNIQPVRARVEKLLEIRRMLGQSECKKNSLGAKVLELEKEKGKDGLLLADLEERLARLHEEKASIVSKINKNESEIVGLKASVMAAEEDNISAKLKFEASLTAPW